MGDTGEQDNSRSGGRTKVARCVRIAREQFGEITGYHPESVSGLRRTEDGWLIQFEVVELERIPDTMSLLATYQVELDEDGDLVGYQRVRRYPRGQADRG
ncbi:gas vesicle protein GvpO [Goodfellowiella coeruleoviolacea]|uniref:Gas vesicle synthesis protein GvpO n=1 Tax=Goodfellowiella coeruleoviolacea TaxID=334858 RepID=A0AAE3GIR1_9PSEU|nr:gas vesicle protein [Goodfellowiella coeruleoviolacea]MCP2168054.1 Gas vesicle synthesis protein GvpO [Goodfellowiella coeruleoviolacea]